MVDHGRPLGSGEHDDKLLDTFGLWGTLFWDKPAILFLFFFLNCGYNSTHCTGTKQGPKRWLAEQVGAKQLNMMLEVVEFFATQCKQL